MDGAILLSLSPRPLRSACGDSNLLLCRMQHDKRAHPSHFKTFKTRLAAPHHNRPQPTPPLRRRLAKSRRSVCTRWWINRAPSRRGRGKPARPGFEASPRARTATDCGIPLWRARALISKNALVCSPLKVHTLSRKFKQTSQTKWTFALLPKILPHQQSASFCRALVLSQLYFEILLSCNVDRNFNTHTHTREHRNVFPVTLIKVLMLEYLAARVRKVNTLWERVCVGPCFRLAVTWLAEGLAITFLHLPSVTPSSRWKRWINVEEAAEGSPPGPGVLRSGSNGRIKPGSLH